MMGSVTEDCRERLGDTCGAPTEGTEREEDSLVSGVLGNSGSVTPLRSIM